MSAQFSTGAVSSENMRVYCVVNGVGDTSAPPHPGNSWTRFVCISDTHSSIFSVPAGDILVHAGDLSSWGHPQQLQITLDWLKTLSHPLKILVAGNHDFCLDPEWLSKYELERRSPTASDSGYTTARTLIRDQAMREAGIIYLEHEAVKVTSATGRTWSIYGSPAAPRYAVGAFQYTGREQAKAIYDRIPKGTEILITHTPPYKILDRTTRGKHAGCPVLKDTLAGLPSCRLHVFGHIHEAHGSLLTPARLSVNAALHNGHEAVVVDLKN